MFRPWAQLRAGEQLGRGSGLGLTLSKDFIEKGFGGKIDFTSSPRSTTFFIEIDFVVSQDIPETPQIADEQIGSETIHHNSFQDSVSDEDSNANVVDVVVVDDSAMNRNLLARTLGLFGLSVATCENGKEAVDMLTGVTEPQVRCRLVLMDKEMPVMDGYAATRALRASTKFRAPIVGVTGNALESQVSEFVAQGVDEVLTKPVKRAAIEDILHRYKLVAT
eukprot:c9395_g1_i1.p2 GENE.c9395_g1_i1~~c9395_g1_i1.p2  ORF type:complete len:221 (+),score=53.90 c9395_g1_i1:1298-1960(+)